MNEDLRGLRALQFRDDKIKKLKSALKASESELSLVKDELAATKAVALHRPTRARRRSKLASASRSKVANHFILGITDNHFTQIVEPETSGGNLHNETVARGRIRSVFEQADAIVRDVGKESPVGEILLWFGGDSMVNADLHPHFRRITPYEPHEELSIVESIFEDILDFASDSSLVTKATRIHGSLSNHGRDGKKEDVSAEIAFRRSFDVTLYRHVFPRYNIPFHIEPSYWGVEQVGGVKTCLHHGHRVSLKENSLGLPMPNWGQLNRRLSHPRHRGTKLFMHGHFHTAMEAINDSFSYVSAGSTVGQDGYSYDLLFPDNIPSQPLIQIRDGRVLKVHRLECP